MEYLQTLWSHLSNIQIADVFDILIVAFLIYKIIPMTARDNKDGIATPATPICNPKIQIAFPATLITFPIMETLNVTLVFPMERNRAAQEL